MSQHKYAKRNLIYHQWKFFKWFRKNPYAHLRTVTTSINKLICVSYTFITVIERICMINFILLFYSLVIILMQNALIMYGFRTKQFIHLQSNPSFSAFFGYLYCRGWMRGGFFNINGIVVLFIWLDIRIPSATATRSISTRATSVGGRCGGCDPPHKMKSTSSYSLSLRSYLNCLSIKEMWSN